MLGMRLENKREKAGMTIAFMVIAIMIAGVLLTAAKADAYAGTKPGKGETIAIQIDAYRPATITNAEGQTLKISKNGDISGTIPVLGKRYSTYDGGRVQRYLILPKSDSFEYKSKSWCDFCIGNDVDKDGNFSVDTFLVSASAKEGGTVKVSFSPETKVSVFAPYGGIMKSQFNISMWIKGKMDIDIDGSHARDTVTLADKGEYYLLSGARGHVGGTLFKNSDMTFFRYYLFSEKTKIFPVRKTISFSDSVRLSDKVSKKPSRLYVRPVHNNRYMALTWSKVRKANSYVVYKYDRNARRYKKVAVRSGRSVNYFIDPIKGRGACAYKVAAKKGYGGRGKTVGSKSYAVSAVPADAPGGNVSHLKIRSGKVIKIKRGSKRRLRAEVSAGSKPLFSSRVRWCTSNRKMLKIDTKTGVIKAKNAGTCYVWAKAHNGLNSKRVKIVISD